MKRRKFFETLGAALAGAALIKPDFSQVEEMIKISIQDEPGKVICNPVDDLNYDNLPVGGMLFYGKKKILTFEGVSYSYHRDWIDVTSTELPEGYRTFITGQEDHNVTLLGCTLLSNIPRLEDIYENRGMCKLVIKMEDTIFMIDEVMLWDIGLNYREELQVKIVSKEVKSPSWT